MYENIKKFCEDIWDFKKSSLKKKIIVLVAIIILATIGVMEFYELGY